MIYFSDIFSIFYIMIYLKEIWKIRNIHKNWAILDLNILQLEIQWADLQTKIEELQLINQSLIENDKVKEKCIGSFIWLVIGFKW